MNQEVNKKRKPILAFFIRMFLIFIIIDFSLMIFANIITESSFVNKYGVDLITELFYALAILIVMLLFHNSYVFTTRKEKFWDGVKLAVPMLVVTGINLLSNLSEIREASFFQLVNVLIFCLFIGIAEEFLCRGWLQNEFIERYSEDRKAVITSIVLASLVFGLMHITNLTVQTPFETLLQIINATALGVLLGSVYYKTKNIWSVIFLHATYDAAIFLGEINLIKDCTYGTPTIGITIVDSVGIIIVSLLWIFSAVYVLQNTNFPDKRPKKNTSKISMLIVITFVALFIPFEKLVPEYDSYKICYNYKEINKYEEYTEHYPNYKNYFIIGNKEENVLKLNESGNVEEGIQEQNYNFEFILSDKGIVSLVNNITNYKTSLKYNDVQNIEVLENEKNYIVVVHTTENESTIYYSDFIRKDSISMEEEYIEEFKNSFIKYELPEVSKFGYITIDDSETKYPYFTSSNMYSFIIKDNELYVIK